MKWLFASIVTLVIGIAAALPTSAQAGPLIHRGGPYDRWVETGYVFPGLWGYNYNSGYYYNPITGYYYYY
jgi:hypothetical protein